MARLLAMGLVVLLMHCAAVRAMEFVVVDEPGNAPDPLYEYGGVDYVFEIGKYEVTNDDYVEFLNAVARQDDPYRLYSPSMSTGLFGGIERSGEKGAYVYRAKPGWGKRPVVYISWCDLARMANWYHYGSPCTGESGPGVTEGTATEGAYDTRRFPRESGVDAAPADIPDVRNPGASYFIPNEDEWYKAAFYDPEILGIRKYWDYPVRTSNLPGNPAPPGGSRSVNYFRDVFAIGKPFFLTEAGNYSEAKSYFGTYDQGGNVWELVESWRRHRYGGEQVKGTRGGSATYSELGMHASNTDGINPAHEKFIVGGRLARVHRTVSGDVAQPDSRGWTALSTRELFLRMPKKQLAVLSFVAGAAAMLLLSVFLVIVVRIIRRVSRRIATRSGKPEIPR